MNGLCASARLRPPPQCPISSLVQQFEATVRDPRPRNSSCGCWQRSGSRTSQRLAPRPSKDPRADASSSWAVGYPRCRWESQGCQRERPQREAHQSSRPGPVRGAPLGPKTSPTKQTRRLDSSSVFIYLHRRTLASSRSTSPESTVPSTASTIKTENTRGTSRNCDAYCIS